MSKSHFDQAAAGWDAEPRRIELMRAVGEAILREARPTRDMDVLDYGCGTGLVSLYLLPRVRSIVGADSSPGMLEVLRRKLSQSGIENMRAIALDLEHERPPNQRFDLVVTSMTLHHVADIDRVLRGFHELLLPGGTLCIADLDAEPGTFHDAESAPSVHHHGFDRVELQTRLRRVGLENPRAVTAHVIRKPVEGGGQGEFPVFLVTANHPR